MTNKELNEIAAPIFERTGAAILYATSDGCVFEVKRHANNHARGAVKFEVIELEKPAEKKETKKKTK